MSRTEPASAGRGYLRAIFAATAVSAALIIATIYIWAFSSYGDVMDPAVLREWLLFLVFTLILFLFTLGLGFAAAMLIFRPALWLLDRTNRFKSEWILTASFVTGLVATQIVFIIAHHSGSAVEHGPGFAEWLMSGAKVGTVAGVCCLAGGIVFCRMTILPKPGADTAPGDS